LIEVGNVRYVYPSGVEALRGVSLEVREGELVAIMGENGSGKTTLLRHLNGLLKPTEGRVLIDGQDTRESTVAELSRKVGIVFQSPDAMFFSETVYSEVYFSLKMFGYTDAEASRRVEWALRLMDLWKYRDRSPFTLSGGEKKRLSIAIVLAWQPKYVVIDEPTAGQDAPNRKRLEQLISKLRSEGATVILSSHDVEFIIDLRPRVILLSRGRIVADGPAESILTDEDKLERASLLLPQIPLIMKKLAVYGVNPGCLTVDEALREITSRLKPVRDW